MEERSIHSLQSLPKTNHYASDCDEINSEDECEYDTATDCDTADGEDDEVIANIARTIEEGFDEIGSREVEALVTSESSDKADTAPDSTIPIHLVQSAEDVLGVDLNVQDTSENCIEICLKLNQAKAAFLREKLETINKLLENNLEETMEQFKTNSSELQNAILNLDSTRKFGMPYFKDSALFPCPKNADTITKARRKEVDFANMGPQLKWQRWEMKLLDDAVRKAAVEKLLNPLKARRARLQEQLNNDEFRGLPTKKTRQLLEQLEEEISEQTGEPLFELLHDAEAELDWMKVSASDFLGRRSANECQAMWRCCLMPGIKRENWKIKETTILKELAHKHKFQDWEKIAEELGTGRSAYQCYIHLQVTFNRKRTLWTKAEDRKLMARVATYRQGSYIPFAKVAATFPGRTSQQCRQRWINSLNPNICSGNFTARDDLILATARHTHGLTFSQISSVLPQRTPGQLRNRYLRLQNLEPSLPWTPEEDRKLLMLVQEKGKAWSEFLQEFPSRDRHQLRGRYERLVKNPESKSKLVTYNAVRKGSVWHTIKNKVDTVSSSKYLEDGQILSFVDSLKPKGRTNRKAKKRDHLDREISQMFRSHYAQPKGRKKVHYSKQDIETLGRQGRLLSEVFSANYDWGAEGQLEQKLHDRQINQRLLHMFRQLKGLHLAEGWNSSRMDVPLAVPPNVTSLVGLRTLLLEERSVLNQSLQVTPFNMGPATIVPKIASKAKGRTTKNSKKRVSSEETGSPTAVSSQAGPSTQDGSLCLPGPSNAGQGPSQVHGDTSFLADSDSGAGCSSDALSEKHLGPDVAMSLWKQRFLALFLFPAIMSQNSPPTIYHKSLFVGQNMARKESDSEQEEGAAAVVEQDGWEEHAVRAREHPSADTGPLEEKPRMTKMQRKRWLKARWQKYRDEKAAVQQPQTQVAVTKPAEGGGAPKPRRGRPPKAKPSTSTDERQE